MNLTFRPLTAVDLPHLLTWQYEPPYDIYSLGNGRVDTAALAEASEYFLDPVYCFYSIINVTTGELAAVVSYGLDGQVSGGDYSEEAVDIGMAVRPDLTGRGLGSEFAGVSILFARQTFRPARLRVTIADFNLRARRVWEKHRFQPVQSFISSANNLAFTIFIRAL